ncbi:hypothetical protein BZA05DRAFT_235020 [Tricharina praecox]|uniref:uncharacterized protein n=1 Tax=Tricharina praecox TaxID=43433 RepID=UPI002220F42B|nr:uncharacterized protein BZA05DRAFT_235020 [Tricharina praecox]KAI5855249.1 hypothetical protein BZA05DRAFT_235020 [Tricharina praecox]
MVMIRFNFTGGFFFLFSFRYICFLMVLLAAALWLRTYIRYQPYTSGSSQFFLFYLFYLFFFCCYSVSCLSGEEVLQGKGNSFRIVSSYDKLPHMRISTVCIVQ